MELRFGSWKPQTGSVRFMQWPVRFGSSDIAVRFGLWFVVLQDERSLIECVGMIMDDGFGC